MLKKIVLHGPALDNVGGYHDGGAELLVGDADQAGFIHPDRARELLDSPRAVSATAAAAEERAAEQATADKDPDDIAADGEAETIAEPERVAAASRARTK